MRIILPCAGKQTRWKDHPTPKHLIKVCGEPILHRTVRLVCEHAPGTDIRIVIRDATDDAFDVPRTSRAEARLNPQLGDVDKFASSRHLWATTDWTLVLFGDVWWSLPAIRKVLAYPNPKTGWTAFARFGPNNVGGEIFGFAIHPCEHDMFDAAITKVAAYADAKKEDGVGLFRGGVRGGWGIYRVLTGGNPLVHENRGHYTEINDWTEDLDSRKDWDRWCLRYARANDRKRKEQVG